MKKIASTLQMLADDPPDGFGTLNMMKAQKELRALLAVATVAKRIGREWEAWDEARPETCAALYRALARLDALSRKGGGK